MSARLEAAQAAANVVDHEDHDEAVVAALAAADAVMFDDSAVERAARSLCAAEFPEASPSYAWDVQFEDGQNHYRQMVRAVITALKDGAE